AAALAAAAAHAVERAARGLVDDTEGDGDDEDEGPAGDDVAPPAEFPERWASFLPPEDVKSRLHHSKQDKE
ncbi:hypothetical protein ADK38_09660, partial [Streptomyces varsoviensis]